MLEKIYGEEISDTGRNYWEGYPMINSWNNQQELYFFFSRLDRWGLPFFCVVKFHLFFIFYFFYVSVTVIILCNVWLGHGIWDPLPSFARIAGAVVLQKKVATLGLHVKANMSLGKKKKKKKESKETIPVNIYWRFFNRTWLVLMCSCFYLLWGDQIKEWSIYIYILMKRLLLPPFTNQSITTMECKNHLAQNFV